MEPTLKIAAIILATSSLTSRSRIRLGLHPLH